MAELPAPPAPVGSVEIAEEPAAGAVPVGAETEPPPVVEDEVFFSPIVFGVVSFFVFLLHVFGILRCYFLFGLFRRVVFFPIPAIFYRFSHFLANGFNICFNILSILLNGNVKSVCQPLSTLL